MDWVPVLGPDPGRYDILVLILKHHSSWCCVGAKIEDQHYTQCLKVSNNKNENRAWCLGYDANRDLLGPGQAGSPAEGQMVCLLTLVKRCYQGRWHLPAQFKLKNQKGRPGQAEATCMKTLFDLDSKHLKCKVSS